MKTTNFYALINEFYVVACIALEINIKLLEMLEIIE